MFACYAENVSHVGPAEYAIRIKLVHNYIAFTNVASWCESFALAARDGLDLDKVIGIISAAGGRSGMLDLYGQATLERVHPRDQIPHVHVREPRSLHSIAVGKASPAVACAHDRAAPTRQPAGSTAPGPRSS